MPSLLERVESFLPFSSDEGISRGPENPALDWSNEQINAQYEGLVDYNESQARYDDAFESMVGQTVIPGYERGEELDTNVFDPITGENWTQGLIDFYRNNGIEPTEMVKNNEMQRTALSLHLRSETDMVTFWRNSEAGGDVAVTLNPTAEYKQTGQKSGAIVGFLDALLNRSSVRGR